MPDLSHVVPLPVRRIELGLDFEDAPRIAGDLREYVPGIAVEAVQRIEKELPEFVRPHDRRYGEALRISVEHAIGHFLDLMADPDTSSAEVLDFWRRIGAGEAMEGRSLEPWHSAIRIGAGVAVERLTERAEQLGHQTPAVKVAGIANAVFGYLNQLATVVGEGHADIAAREAGSHQERRRRLLDLLLGRPAPALKDLREPALEASWPLPRTVAAVALRERGPDTRRPTLPPDVLLGLHLPEPCLVVPDPDGPGRQRLLERHLPGWSSAIGPTVEPIELAKSLRLARSALALAGEGLIDDSRPIATEMHMPIIVMMQERELVERVIKRRLAPLDTVRPPHHYRLAETLMLFLECGFNATEVSARLHLHAQTVRYRLRRLEALFGDSLHDANDRLELHMALRAWLTINAQPAATDQLRIG